jgi:hypothetical protein
MGHGCSNYNMVSLQYMQVVSYFIHLIAYNIMVKIKFKIYYKYKHMRIYSKLS